MPYKKTKNKDGTYKVTGPSGTHAKSSTKANAEAQMRLLYALEDDPNFKAKNSKKKKKSPRGSRSSY